MKKKNEPFGWMLVSKTGNTAYMIGTWFECARWQLLHGVRATTIII